MSFCILLPEAVKAGARPAQAGRASVQPAGTWFSGSQSEWGTLPGCKDWWFAYVAVAQKAGAKMEPW